MQELQEFAFLGAVKGNSGWRDCHSRVDLVQGLDDHQTPGCHQDRIRSEA